MTHPDGRPRGRRGKVDPDDEMYAETATDEMFSGPAPEAIPSSYSSFRHRAYSRSHSGAHVDHDEAASYRRPSFDTYGRRDSMVSAHSFQSASQQGTPLLSASHTSLGAAMAAGVHGRERSESQSSFRFFTWDEIEQAEGATTIANDVDPVELMAEEAEDFDALDGDALLLAPPDAPEPALPVREPRRRRSSTYYQESALDEPLLADAEHQAHHTYHSERQQQRYYISEEDLVIGLAGYKSSRLRQALYVALCVATLGIAYLVLRWFPRWRIACLGTPAPLGQCEWVVVENQWGDLEILDVGVARYDSQLSTVFRNRDAEKHHQEHHERENGHMGERAARAAAGHAGTTTTTQLDETADEAAARAADYSREEEEEYVDKDPMVPSLRWFDYRYLRFLYHPLEDIFLTNTDWVDPQAVDMEALQAGLDSDLQHEREKVFGANVLDVKEKTTAQLLVDEILHPFYVFQVFSMLLWAADEYYYYAGCIFLISIVSVGNTLVETKRSFARLREISRFECDMHVLRSGFWVTVPSSEVVPGDVYEISDPAIHTVPCDSLLLSGDCIVNESMLTGESVPVSKVEADDAALRELRETGNSISDAVAKHYLYSGTKIVRVRRPRSRHHAEDFEPALALAVRTGFSTTKGALLRSMMFPKPTGFKFYSDSFKYIGVMGLVAVCGFVVSTVNFLRMGMPTHLIVFRALDLITIVVPPALPATLTIGINISLARLRAKQIFCIAPTRVNVGGKLDVICFDKTGTLTEDGLDVLGVHRREGHQFGGLLESAKDLSGRSRRHHNDRNHSLTHPTDDLLSVLATCHSLRHIDDELMGDPLDAKMFEWTGWTFQESDGHGGGAHVERLSMSPDRRVKLSVARTFEFVSQLRRMCVIAHNETTGDYAVCVKGAPEVMRAICDPSTLPNNFDDLLHEYTHRGYRVIACASRPLGPDGKHVAAETTRDEAESGLAFLGFIVFENKLKGSTSRTIAELADAKIRTIMCTGDNALTAVSVGRECGMVSKGTVVYAPHFEQVPAEELYGPGSGTDPVDVLRWESIDDRSMRLDDAMRPFDLSVTDYTLAVTGEAFRFIIERGDSHHIEQMLIKSSIFARMSPDEKHELVEKLQGIGYTTGFCGDGANDCGALKAADVGVSLSEAEASVAAPFTSRIFEISCVLDVIKEGRCALATSFSCFKYMSLYSAIQFVTVSILYSLGSNLGDFQFLYIDLALILPIAIFMAWSNPYPKLYQKRPTANLVSRKVLVPLIGEIALLAGFQFLVWALVRRQPWYTPPVMGAEDADVSGSDNTVLFWFSCFQYIFVAMVLSVGPPFREPMYKNLPFMATVFATVMLTFLLMCVDPDAGFGQFMNLTYASTQFKLLLVVLAAVNFALCWVGYKQLFPAMAVLVQRARRALGIKKIRKRYKVLNAEHSAKADV